MSIATSKKKEPSLKKVQEDTSPVDLESARLSLLKASHDLVDIKAKQDFTRTQELEENILLVARHLGEGTYTQIEKYVTHMATKHGLYENFNFEQLQAVLELISSKAGGQFYKTDVTRVILEETLGTVVSSLYVRKFLVYFLHKSRM